MCSEIKEEDGHVTIGKFKVFTNGSGELFVKVITSGSIYRMNESDGKIMVSSDGLSIQHVGGGVIGTVLNPTY